MQTLTKVAVSVYYAVRLPALKQRGKEWRCPCPIHRGKHDSFTVDPTTGRWFCHSKCGRGGDIINLQMELAETDFQTAMADVNRIVGTPEPGREELAQRGERRRGPIVATYDYRDESGQLLYQCVRREPKDFSQRRPDGRGGWIWSVAGSRKVLYRLSEVLEAAIVFVAEGEKDCETLRSHGFVATTNVGGADAPWLAEYTDTLRGREVIIIPDADLPGRRHALTVARALLGSAAKLTIVELEGAKDISDWFAGGHSEIELIALVEGDGVRQ